MSTSDTYRVHLDGRWELPELGEFARLYSQCYSYIYSLLHESIDEEYPPFWEVGGAYPWRGGWSSFNFYEILYARLPPEHKLGLRKLRHESPGFAEFALAVDVAQQLAVAVGLVVGSIASVETLYHRIHKHAQERKLLTLDVRARELDLAEREKAFVAESIEELAPVLGVDPTLVRANAKSDLGALKILLSYYRRLIMIARLQRDGKVRL